MTSTVDKEIRLLAEVLKSSTIVLSALLLSTNLTHASTAQPIEPEIREYKVELMEPLEATEFERIDTVAKLPTPKPKTQPVASVSVSGDKYDWMRQAGIPESDWQYVDYIVSKESSWNPNAINKSSGACSLAQSLPCSKIKGNWRDPVVALKWQHSYVRGRYGSYAEAYKFWLQNSWY